MMRTPTLPALIVGSLAAWPAAADVTPADVWTSWQAMMASNGDTSVASEETGADGTLTLTGVQRTQISGDTTIDVTIERIVMTPNGDGTVTITQSQRTVYDVAVANDGDADTTFAMTLDGAMAITASGDPGAVSYTVAAPALTMTLGDLVVDGDPTPVDATVTLTDLAMNYTHTDQPGAPDRLEQAWSIAEATMDMTLDTPADPAADRDPGRLAVQGGWSDVLLEGEGPMMNFVGTQTPDAMAGIGDVTSRLSHGDGRLAIAFDAAGDETRITTRSDAGSMEIGLADGAIAYGAATEGLAMTAAGSQMPPIAATIDAVRVALAGPIGVSDAVRPVAMTLDIDGLDPAEEVWALFDPEGVLPRDPARLMIDVAGNAVVQADLSDPSAMQSDEAPISLQDVTLRALELSAAGAKLTGTGAVAFPEGTSTDGAPPADGSIELTLAGSDALIDGLVSLGVVPGDQAMMARAMIGMFTRPGAEPGTLSTSVEFAPDGGISVNGQSVR